MALDAFVVRLDTASRRTPPTTREPRSGPRRPTRRPRRPRRPRRADPDAHARADPDAHARADPDAHARADPDAHARADPDAHARADPDAHARADPDAHARADPDAHARADPDAHARADPDAHARADPDAHARADPDAHARADPDAHARADPDADPPTPTPRPAPAPTPTPTLAPTPAGSSVRVTSIPALLTALADNAVTDIVVANGTYHVSPAGSQRSDSLWIGARFAGRTRAVTVRAETRGGVTFDGGGATSFTGLAFVDAVHDQTWDGFNFANGQATNTGIISFGGNAGLAGPHHITLSHITILASCTGHNDQNDHGIYFSWASDGPHDILIEDLTVDGSGPAPLSSALHFYHSDTANRNAWNVTIRRLVVTGTYQAVILWDSTLRNITIDGATITNARYNAVRYENPGSGIVLKDIDK